MLKSVACDHVTSFNYDGKKARDVGVTFWCRMSNIVPDSMLHESMRQGINVLFFCFVLVLYLFFCFLRGDISVFLMMKDRESVLSI